MRFKLNEYDFDSLANKSTKLIAKIESRGIQCYYACKFFYSEI